VAWVPFPSLFGVRWSSQSGVRRKKAETGKLFIGGNNCAAEMEGLRAVSQCSV
jgi:hypothetical protein